MATNLSANSATLTIRLDADALATFDSFAVARGGRSAVLRQMIEQTVREIADRPFIDRPDGVARNRVSLRFTDVEIAVIAHRASQRSTDRAGWIKALVRDHGELAPIRMQLLRIGRNLNQAMKAANASMLETGDKQIEPELRRIADMRMEISEQVTAVGDAMRGDAGYWTVAD
jgi:hypothetical protein